MIVIKIEVHSAITGQVQKKGHMVIVNDGAGTPTVGHYIFRLYKSMGKPGIWKSGRVRDFPRKRLGAWDLLYRVLREAVGDRNP